MNFRVKLFIIALIVAVAVSVALGLFSKFVFDLNDGVAAAIIVVVTLSVVGALGGFSDKKPQKKDNGT